MRDAAGAVARLTRSSGWHPKLLDLSMFTGFAFAATSRYTADALVTACLFLTAATALAVFGYAWNDVCDAEIDARAGKSRPGRGASRVVAVVAVGVAALCSAAASRLDATLMIVAFASLALAWAYSARPLRLKERGLAGLVAGAVAQRPLPAAFLAIAFELPVRESAPWLVWMTCFGMRAMVVHQAEDAAADRSAGVRTWAAARSAETHRRAARMLFALEAPALALALVPLLDSAASVALATVAAFAAWALCAAAALRRGAGRVDWLSVGALPFQGLSLVFAPGVVGVALAASEARVGIAWLALDAVVRARVLWWSWKRIVELGRLSVAAVGARLAAESER